MKKFADDKIEVYFGPKELGADDNLEEVIIDFINGAKKTLDIAVQEIDSEPIAQAIIDASWRGISVNVFLEQHYVKREELPKVNKHEDETEDEAKERYQWEEYRRPKDSKSNRDILSALLRNKVNVHTDFNKEIFHQKFIIRDYRGKTITTSAVLTGSTNFTHTGTHHNPNNIVIFRNYWITKQFREEFEEIEGGTFGTKMEGKKKAPRRYNVKGVPVKVLFAPDDGPELEYVKEMLKAEDRVDFAIFTFSGSSGIDDAMKVLRKAGVKVRGVMDPGQGRRAWSATEWLHDKGIDVYFPNDVEGFGKLHHKMMVIDKHIVIGGSMNFTAPANELNDENIFVIGSPYELDSGEGGPVDHAECKKIALYFRGEIDRLIAGSTLYQPPT